MGRPGAAAAVENTESDYTSSLHTATKSDSAFLFLGSLGELGGAGRGLRIINSQHTKLLITAMLHYNILSVSLRRV